MKLIALFLTLTLTALAQTTITLSGPVSVRPGQSVEIVTTLSTTALPAGLQWSMSVPAPLSVTSAMTGTSSVAAEKTLYQSDDGITHILVGMNINSIAPGPVAKHTISVPASASKGSYSIQLSGLVAGDANGDEIVLTTGTNYSLLVLAKTDLNGDGTTNVSDLGIMLNQVFGLVACTDDMNGDNKCNIRDILIIIRGM